LLSQQQLVEILDKSIENNKKTDITGMLLYKSGNFMQYIEGPKDNILKLMEVIGEDDRHNTIIEIMSGEISTRNFADWSMGFYNMDQLPDLPRFQDYIALNLNSKTFNDEGRNAFDFMMTFNEINR
jgi:hypothetical protein